MRTATFQFPESRGSVNGSSLNCLSCRNPYQAPHSLNCLPPFLSIPFPKIGSDSPCSHGLVKISGVFPVIATFSAHLEGTKTLRSFESNPEARTNELGKLNRDIGEKLTENWPRMEKAENRPKVARRQAKHRISPFRMSCLFLRSYELTAARGAEQEGRNPAQGSRGFGAP